MYLDNTVDSNGNLCNNGSDTSVKQFAIGKTPILTNTYIKHYIYKTLEEFIDVKMKREQSKSFNRKNPLSFDSFFRYNEKTPEKIQYLKDRNLI